MPTFRRRPARARREPNDLLHPDGDNGIADDVRQMLGEESAAPIDPAPAPAGGAAVRITDD